MIENKVCDILLYIFGLWSLLHDSSFFYSISGGGISYHGYGVCPSYMPCLTDFFLLENPFSNSQVTKRIQ